MPSNKVLTINPGERWYSFSQSALDELIANKVNAALEKAAERAWMVLVGQGADWSIRQSVGEAIRSAGNVASNGGQDV